MALCLGLTAMVGCGKSDDITKPATESDTFPYYTVRTDVKSDGQYYMRDDIVFPDSLWETPKSERYAALDRDEVKAYFIDSVQNTKVFVYVGIPETANAANKVPAVVLVHGATGTAFADWVQMWVERGYAAIAMDTEGRMPTATCTTMNPEWDRLQESIYPHGPHNSSFSDAELPVGEQWVYHALASVIASASFISSFAEVDATKLGITGASYGGFLTCMAAGYDDRYSFAAPVYGCLSNSLGAGEFGTYVNGYPASVPLWDDLAPLQASRTPFLFVNNISDTFFAPDCITRSVKACRAGGVSFLPNLAHGHYQGAKVREVFAFADEVFYGTNALVRLSGDPTDGYVHATLPKGVTIAKAQLYYTLSDVLNSTTTWESVDANIVGNDIIFDSDESYKHYYVRIMDNQGRYVSSTVA